MITASTITLPSCSVSGKPLPESALRPLLETCRGQVDQPLLDLFAYGPNHRRFVRGKRAGKAPIEILTGKDMAQTWLPSLLEAI